MYTIVKRLNGTFLCMGRIQDGTERWEEKSLDEAVKSMKSFAKVMNGARGEHKLKRKHITFLQEQWVSEIKYVAWNPV